MYIIMGFLFAISVISTIVTVWLLLGGKDSEIEIVDNDTVTKM